MQLCCIKIMKHRKTRTQNFVLEEFQKANKALSQSEILKTLDGKVNRVTIYRIMDRFESQGILHKLIDGEGIAKYALCKDCEHEAKSHHHNHIHFNCTNCHEVTCIEQAPIQYELPKEYLIEKINFNVIGICPKCTIKD